MLSEFGIDVVLVFCGNCFVCEYWVCFGGFVCGGFVEVVVCICLVGLVFWEFVGVDGCCFGVVVECFCCCVVFVDGGSGGECVCVGCECGV